MWSDWVGALSDGIDAELGGGPNQPGRISVRDAIYALMGVDEATGRVMPHGALAATPMARLREAVGALLREGGIPTDRAAAALDAAWHSPDPVTLARPVTDLPALFGTLRSRGVRVAIATSDDRGPTERTIAHLGVADLVEGLACADDGRPVKPEPHAVAWLCDLLGVAPDRAAVIGDAPADLLMGRRAGAGRVVGVLTGVGDLATLDPLADLVLGSVAELVAPDPG